MQLQEWFMQNMPDEKQLSYGKAAISQIMWVRDDLTWLISRQVGAVSASVEGTHMSKSILLPVYKLEGGGIKIKIRDNFHDLCVRVWCEQKKPFPKYMEEVMGTGCFEGMTCDRSPISFTVSTKEQLYSVLWWLLSEGRHG